MRWGCLMLLLLGAASMAGESSGEQKAVAEIEALYADWRVAVEAGDIGGYVALLHPQVRMLPPGADPVVGAESYGAFLVPVFATATYEIEVDRAPHVQVVGDVAVAEYEYTIVLNRKDPEVGVTEPGALTANRTPARYFDVLRRTDDGDWRVWRHTWQNK